MGKAVIKISLPLFFSGDEHSANISTRAFQTVKPFANTLFIPLPELYPSPTAPVAHKLYMQGILCHYALFREPIHWKLKCLKKREGSTGNEQIFFPFPSLKQIAEAQTVNSDGLMRCDSTFAKIVTGALP